MIVDKDEQVLISCAVRPNEWSGNVSVYQAASVRRFVQRRVVRVSRCVGLSACSAAIKVSVSERTWGVRGDVRKVSQAV
eukprot:2336911-Pleurochrysis_carterae.AAC.5